MTESLEHRRGVMEGANQPDLGDVELLRRLEQHVARQALIAQPRRHPLGNLLALGVGTPRDGHDRHPTRLRCLARFVSRVAVRSTPTQRTTPRRRRQGCRSCPTFVRNALSSWCHGSHPRRRERRPPARGDRGASAPRRSPNRARRLGRRGPGFRPAGHAGRRAARPADRAGHRPAGAAVRSRHRSAAAGDPRDLARHHRRGDRNHQGGCVRLSDRAAGRIRSAAHDRAGCRGWPADALSSQPRPGQPRASRATR